MNSANLECTHALIRSLLLSESIDDVAWRILEFTFPLYESASDRNVPRLCYKNLSGSAKNLYRSLELPGHYPATCISISLSIFACALSSGWDAKLIIGILKLDEKLFSHAWVELDDSRIIDPMGVYQKYKPIKDFSIRTFLQSWDKRCAALGS